MKAFGKNAIIANELRGDSVGEMPQARSVAVAASNDNETNRQDELRILLDKLQQEHRDLDAAIQALQDSPGADVLQVQRLKKRKLGLKDRIGHIEDQLTPDIIA